MSTKTSTEAFVTLRRGITVCDCSMVKGSVFADCPQATTALVGSLDELLQFIEEHPHMDVERVGRAKSRPSL